MGAALLLCPQEQVPVPPAQVDHIELQPGTPTEPDVEELSLGISADIQRQRLVAVPRVGPSQFADLNAGTDPGKGRVQHCCVHGVVSSIVVAPTYLSLSSWTPAKSKRFVQGNCERYQQLQHWLECQLPPGEPLQRLTGVSFQLGNRRSPSYPGWHSGSASDAVSALLTADQKKGGPVRVTQTRPAPPRLVLDHHGPS